jgi:hypothetical protein
MLQAIFRQIRMVIFAKGGRRSIKFARVSCLRVEYDSEGSIGRKCEVLFLLIMNTSYPIAMP